MLMLARSDQQWLKNWPRNPFASAAWIHLVIATIHPFEVRPPVSTGSAFLTPRQNGNGRVARLVASIPFIKADLPPLCILSNSAMKKDYFEGIGKVSDLAAAGSCRNLTQVWWY